MTEFRGQKAEAVKPWPYRSDVTAPQDEKGFISARGWTAELQEYIYGDIEAVAKDFVKQAESLLKELKSTFRITYPSIHIPPEPKSVESMPENELDDGRNLTLRLIDAMIEGVELPPSIVKGASDMSVVVRDDCRCDFYADVCEAGVKASIEACPCDPDCKPSDSAKFSLLDSLNACVKDNHCDKWCPEGPLGDPDCLNPGPTTARRVVKRERRYQVPTLQSKSALAHESQLQYEKFKEILYTLRYEKLWKLEAIATAIDKMVAEKYLSYEVAMKIRMEIFVRELFIASGGLGALETDWNLVTQRSKQHWNWDKAGEQSEDVEKYLTRSDVEGLKRELLYREARYYSKYRGHCLGDEIAKAIRIAEANNRPLSDRDVLRIEREIDKLGVIRLGVIRGTSCRRTIEPKRYPPVLFDASYQRRYWMHDNSSPPTPRIPDAWNDIR